MKILRGRIIHDESVGRGELKKEKKERKRKRGREGTKWLVIKGK